MRMIPFAMTIGIASLLQQCLNNNKKKDNESNEDLDKEEDPTAGKEKDDEEEGNKKDEESNTGGENTSVFTSSQPKCVDDSNQVALDKVKNAEEAYDPIVKLFGIETNAMVVIALPKYQHSNLKDIYLLTHDGKLLAHKGLSELSDIDVDKTLKPILFDQIFIGNNRNFALLYQNIDNQYSKYILKEAAEFETTFKDKKVYGLSPISVPTPDYYSHHLNNIVTPVKDQFDYQQDPTANIFAGSDTKFHPLSIDNDSYLTDLIGNEISTENGAFSEFGRYQTLIHYKKVREYYLRTFIKIV